MGKIDDLYTHPEWKGIIDLADVTSYDLVERPDERPDAKPGSTVKTFRLFFKSTMQVHDVLQGDIAEKVFYDLQFRVIARTRYKFPTREELDVLTLMHRRPRAIRRPGYSYNYSRPNPITPDHGIRTLDGRTVYPASEGPTHAEFEPFPGPPTPDHRPLSTAPVPRADGKPGGLTHEQAKTLRDSFIPQREERMEKLYHLGIIDDQENFLSHPFKAKYNDIVKRNINVCEYCDQIGADPKHINRVIIVHDERYIELVKLGVISVDRQLKCHEFNPKTDLNTRQPVDICQYCDMPSADETHGALFSQDNPTPSQCSEISPTGLQCYQYSNHPGMHAAEYKGSMQHWSNTGGI